MRIIAISFLFSTLIGYFGGVFILMDATWILTADEYKRALYLVFVVIMTAPIAMIIGLGEK